MVLNLGDGHRVPNIGVEWMSASWTMPGESRSFLKHILIVSSGIRLHNESGLVARLVVFLDDGGRLGGLLPLLLLIEL